MTKVLFFFGNWIPSFLIIGFITMLCFCMKSQFLFIYIFFYLYFLPVLLYRIFNFIIPKKYGRCEIFTSRYNCWWYGVQFQTIYTRFPVLEEFLRIFPFAYSFWLRLWGAKIGRFIFWSPGVLIVDRGDLEIGDHCVIGYGAKFTSHLLTKSHKKNLLIYEKICLKSNVFIGAEVNIGPGVMVNSDVVIAALSTLLPFSQWKNSKEYNSREI